RFVVEATHPLSATEIARQKGMKIEAFASTKNPVFARTYVVSGSLNLNELKKLNWVKSAEETFELTKLSLLPGENAERLVEDELFPYQWALLNQGQTFIREKDDIHNLPMKGVSQKDIGWKQVFRTIPKERPIVAVLDSGV